MLGLNGRLDTLQAAILLAKLGIFDDEVEARSRIGARYTRLFAGAVSTQVIDAANTSVFAQYTVEVDERERVIRRLGDAGIPTAVHYPSPLHMQPAFASLGHGAGSFPHAERAAKRVLSLPMHPYLTDADQDRVVAALIAAVRDV